MTHVANIRRSYPRDTAECGHGTCGAVVDCTGECALKAAVINLPVVDEKFFDEQRLHAKLREMGNPMPIQYADDELIPGVIKLIPGDVKSAGWLKLAAYAICAGALLALVIAVSSK